MSFHPGMQISEYFPLLVDRGESSPSLEGTADHKVTSGGGRGTQGINHVRGVTK